MKRWTLTCAVRALLSGLVLGTFLPSASAQNDAWQLGRTLFNTTFNGNKCANCHYNSVSEPGKTNKAMFTAAQIKTAIGPGTGSKPDMSYLQEMLSDEQLSQIENYLSTPKHASLTPVTDSLFLETAIDFLPRRTLSFKLTNNGLVDLIPAGNVDTTSSGFRVNALNCNKTSLSALPVNGQCTVDVTFLPSSVSTFERTFSVNHDGFPSTTSTATVSGTGVKNLEITPTSLPPFVATKTNTSAPQDVNIANRLSTSLKFCLEGLAPFPASLGEFELVGKTYVDENPNRRCVTLTSPGAEVKQSISFTPKEDGPRLAQLSVQRLDDGGSAVGDPETIVLKGNDGPFASVSDGTLFSGVLQDVNAGAAARPTSVTVTNAGSAPLRVSSISIPRVAGAGSDEYTASGCTAGTTLALGKSCNLSVSFDPNDIGVRTTTLMIGYSDEIDTPASRRTAQIFLSGQGTRGASLLVTDAGGTTLATGSQVAFGRQNIAITYTRRLTLTNIGTNEGLAVSAPTIVPGTGFDLVSPSASEGGCGPLTTGFALAAKTNCVVDVRFLPTAVTNYATNLTLPSAPVGSGASPTAMVLALSGEGVDGRPNLAWQRDDGSALALLEVPGVTSVGTPTPPQVSLRLRNNGPGAAALTLLNVIGFDSSSFALEPSTASDRCSFGDSASVLGEGSTCSVAITFRPQTAGAKTGRLQLVSTGTTPAPLEIRAQASGPAATIALTAAPASMNLNEVRVGAQSPPATITLSNDGTVSAVVTAINASSSFTYEPGSCGALPFSIEPRSSCTLSVRFTPSSTGASSGSLRVQVSGLVAPVEVALQGTGAEAANVSGGGCSISDGRSPADPTLWTLVLLAAALLFYRSRRRGSASHDGNPRRKFQ